MENKIENSINKLIHLPYDYRIRGNVTPMTLLTESNYVELCDRISEEHIAALLKQHPHLINEWLLWSENQRTGDRVLIFTKFDSDNYSVAYSYDSNESDEVRTTDEFAACAAYVKREADNLKSYLLEE